MIPMVIASHRCKYRHEYNDYLLQWHLMKCVKSLSRSHVIREAPMPILIVIPGQNKGVTETEVGGWPLKRELERERGRMGR